MKIEVVGIVPVKANSERMKKKNLRRFANTNLYELKLKQLKKTKNFKKHSKFLTNIKFNTFYFTHSYAFKCSDKSNVLGSTFYGETVHSIINKNNVYGVQFHPEKSSVIGEQILKNFIDINI